MSKQNILIAIIVAALAGTGFLLFRNSGTPPTPAESAADSRLSDLHRLKTLQLDTSILQDPFFQSLEVNPVETGRASDVATGRANPFLPF